VVGRVWSEHFPARIRLTALVLGHLADAAGRATQAERAGLTDRLPELRLGVDRAEQRVRLRKLPLGPEGVAWLARARAEELRLRWLADAEAPSEHDLIAGWQATVEAFTAMGSPFETARSQADHDFLPVNDFERQVRAHSDYDHVDRVGTYVDCR